jgi:hypothetical protein
VPNVAPCHCPQDVVEGFQDHLVEGFEWKYVSDVKCSSSAQIIIATSPQLFFYIRKFWPWHPNAPSTVTARHKERVALLGADLRPGAMAIETDYPWEGGPSGDRNAKWLRLLLSL